MTGEASQYRVYVVRNPAGKRYIGLTDDVGRRLDQHNEGVSTWTRGRGPWELEWQSEVLGLGQARKLENWLKRQKGGNGFYERTGLQRIGDSQSR